MTRRRKKAKGYFDTEAELAAVVVQHHKDDGWEVYEEVAPRGGGSRRADIVAVKDGRTRVIECKTSLGFPVLYQGQGWVGYADEVFVAVPWLQVWTGRSRGTNNLAVRCALEVIQIGVINVKPADPYIRPEPKVRIRVPEEWPKTVPRLKQDLDRMLCPEVQDFKGSAGSAGGNFWTPFKGTCKKLFDLLEKHPNGLSVRDAVDKIEHHYASDQSARGSLSTLAKKGVVPGIAFEKRGNTPYLIRHECRTPKEDA